MHRFACLTEKVYILLVNPEDGAFSSTLCNSHTTLLSKTNSKQTRRYFPSLQTGLPSGIFVVLLLCQKTHLTVLLENCLNLVL